MSGIFFLGVIGVLGYVTWLLSRRIMRPIQNVWLRKGATAALVLLGMTLLVADEIIGGYQFRKLCRENAVLRIDPDKARGRTIKVVIDPSNAVVPGTAITIYHSHVSFRDTGTNEQIADYDGYVAKGGWLIRTLGISEGNTPLTIGRAGCTPSDSGTINKRYGFTLAN